MARTQVDEQELRGRLTPQEYQVTREKGTEPAFTGAYWDSKDEGVYRCKVCEVPLFTSDTKYDSGTGWPSFYKAVSDDAVKLEEDRSYGDDPDRGHLRELRQPPRSRVPRRPAADGRAVLHELRVSAVPGRRRRRAEVVRARAERGTPES